MDNAKLLGIRLKELRLVKEESLDNVAIKTGITKSLLSRYERGLVTPGLFPLIKLSKYYDISLDRLVKDMKV